MMIKHLRKYLLITHSTRGLTLTELLVSSILMGIIMVGIAGFSVSIKRMQDTSDKQGILAMQVAATMSYMESNISQTYGSAAELGQNGNPCTPNSATFCFDSGPPQAYWSFRRDPSNTPTNYADDVWSIVFRQTNGADQDSLYGCTQTMGIGPGQGPNPDPGQTPCGANRFPLLYRKLNRSLAPNNIQITWVSNPAFPTLSAYVQISIDALFNGNGTADPIDNPGYSMTTRVSLPSYSNN